MYILKRTTQIIAIILSLLGAYYCFHELTKELSPEELARNVRPMDKFVCIAGILIFATIAVSQLYSFSRIFSPNRKHRKKRKIR